jgi:hypothetical protein
MPKAKRGKNLREVCKSGTAERRGVVVVFIIPRGRQSWLILPGPLSYRRQSSFRNTQKRKTVRARRKKYSIISTARHARMIPFHFTSPTRRHACAGFRVTGRPRACASFISWLLPALVFVIPHVGAMSNEACGNHALLTSTDVFGFDSPEENEGVIMSRM